MKLRPYRAADFEQVADLLDEISLVAYGFIDQPRDELRQWFTAPGVDPENDIRLAFDGDALIGYVDVDSPDEADLWLCDVRVRPGADAGSVVPTLIRWAEERAGHGRVHVWAPSTLAEMRRAIETEGYERVRASFRMEIDLNAGLGRPAWPDGIAVSRLQAGEERIAYEVHEESFEDSWEHHREPYEEWRHWLVDTDAFDPSLWFLAWARDAPAGVAICRVRNGIGWVAVLGVRRPWRRRGLGRALLLHAFQEFRSRGLERAGLGVDAESLTGANRLYESVGMRRVRELDIFEKRIG